MDDLGYSVPILLDTDIGSDVDDAIALAYLLAQPRCDLLGITTVTGDVRQRAACADAVCRAAGKHDIPIRTGNSDPLGPGPGQPDVPHYGAIERRVRDAVYESDAVGFMRHAIRSRPGEVVLLSVGPFTNVAALFASDPDVSGVLRGYVSMGGTFPDATVADWNIQVDPVAAVISYRWAPDGHLSVGLDVTRRLQLSAEEAREAFASPGLEPVREMADVYLAEQKPFITLHDPLAAAVIFSPNLCQYAVGTVEVALDANQEGSGITHFREGHSTTDRITIEVNLDRAKNEVLSVLAGQI